MARQTENAATVQRRYDPRRLLLHYVFAVALILGLLVAGTTVHRTAMREAARDAEATSLVARQRTTSQRMLFLASEYRTGGASTDAELLSATAALFERFTADIAGRLSAAELPSGFGERATAFASAARTVATSPRGSQAGEAAMRKLREAGVSQVLADLDSLAVFFGQRARETRAATDRRDAVTLGIVVAILAAEGMLVFWPAHRAAIASFDSMATTANAMQREKDELESETRRLAFSATHDPLTGLANREKLHEALTDLIGRSDVDPGQICVLHVDLDRFKELNDRLGHAMGDAALKRLAEVMQARVRRDDIVARVGGDEFVIVLLLESGTTEITVHEICERLIAQIREPMVVNGADIQLGASIGYTFASAETSDATTLVANADMALYEAKRDGKGVARPFTDRMRAEVRAREALADDIARALDAGEFVPYFQPLVETGTSRLIGIEMVARWAHPERGLILPEDFMVMADEFGLVDAIEARVFLDGLDSLAALRQRGWEIPRLSLSASTRTMRYDDYAERLTDAVHARGFLPRQIAVEVDETALVGPSRDQAAATISKLRGLGYNVYVDDFGTGYSSLTSLVSLDVNGLKIDRSLIAEIDDPGARRIVRAIVGLSHAMSLTVVADGVGTAALARDLGPLGIDVVQGGAIAPPMPAEDLLPWLVAAPHPSLAAAGDR